jgi:hypothetical protein
VSGALLRSGCCCAEGLTCVLLSPLGADAIKQLRLKVGLPSVLCCRGTSTAQTLLGWLTAAQDVTLLLHRAWTVHDCCIALIDIVGVFKGSLMCS